MDAVDDIRRVDTVVRAVRIRDFGEWQPASVNGGEQEIRRSGDQEKTKK